MEEIFIQICRLWCLSNETVTGREQSDWCEALYEAKAAELILYGRALGLTHGEAEDVLQETFLVLLKLPQRPLEPEHYCVRSYRNRALNHRRSLWRRLTRELEAFAGGHHWFEKSSDETEQSLQTAAVDCLTALPVEQREAIVLKIWHRFTFEEIGGLLGISPNTAAGRYRYGLRKIKLQLEGIVYGRERDEITGGPVALLASAPGVGNA
jgi:RNA polymerase sigma-70 factor (ECF subfamily)